MEVIIFSKAALVPLRTASHQLITFFYYFFHELLSDLQLEQADVKLVLRVKRPRLGYYLNIEQNRWLDSRCDQCLLVEPEEHCECVGGANQNGQGSKRHKNAEDAFLDDVVMRLLLHVPATAHHVYNID